MDEKAGLQGQKDELIKGIGVYKKKYEKIKREQIAENHKQLHDSQKGQPQRSSRPSLSPSFKSDEKFSFSRQNSIASASELSVSD